MARYMDVCGAIDRHGFMVNALLAAIGSVDRSEAPKWLNQQAFMGGRSITLQVHQLIVGALASKAYRQN